VKVNMCYGRSTINYKCKNVDFLLIYYYCINCSLSLVHKGIAHQKQQISGKKAILCSNSTAE